MDARNMKIAFHTLGCKVNLYETEVMRELAVQAGFSVVPFDTEADIYVVNTCTVTNMADRKSRSYLRRPRKLNPDALIVACGCYAQVAGESLLSEGVSDIVVGADEKQDLLRILEDYFDKGIRRPVRDVSLRAPYAPMRLSEPETRTRADIKVQDGCNQFCSYCIIPYARGRIRSRECGDVLREITELSEKGVQEFVLTGIHLSSYGRDFPDAEGDEFLKLVRAVSGIPGVKRIRFGSLEPRIVTEGFARSLSDIPKICPHFHLSLQSGSAETLRRMNRHYGPDEYRKSCEILRKYFDEPALTTDVIVGFPGETEQEFEESRRFVEEIGFYELHVFKYSRRKGTVADRMPSQVPEELKTQRSDLLLQLSEKMSESYRMKKCGTEAEVLTEQPGTFQGKPAFFGYTREYIRTAILGDCGGNRIVSGTLRPSPEPGLMLLIPNGPSAS